MSRDVVLDIIFTKMIGREYMAGVDCEWAALEEDVAVARALVTKGLVRQYAGALQRQDVAAMTRVSKALDEVSVAKGTAVEMWNMLTGQVQREVRRDERGRFTRNISSESYPKAPDERSGPGTRTPGKPAATKGLYNSITNQMQGRDPLGNDIIDLGEQDKARKRGRRQAGQVRAIQRLQDELIEVFGETNDDVIVIVETVPEPGQEAQRMGTLGLKDPVSIQTQSDQEGVLPSSGDDDLQVTYGIRDGASADTREKFDTLGGLVDIGMRPESAIAYAAGKDGKVSTPGQALASQALTYGGRKKDSNKEKATRHFQTADKLGTYFTESGVPQLAGAGRALKATAKIGQAVPEGTYEMAERANYRYRGMKDNLPKAMTSAMNAPEHKMLTGAFNDSELTPEKWSKQLEDVGDYLQGLEQRNKDVFYAEPYRPVLAAAIASTPAGVSPRDFLDRYSRDLAIMALIPELPADSRAVKLGEDAGFGVPSSGVVIRPDGAFKEMYRGAGPDHYLPFSGKALPELRDGQYVRTRYRGGLTNEDISVLVASGGRKATVVSSSGMFTIELKPDTALEGRMRSPEVAAMGERYERILDQVSASKVYMKDLDPLVKEKLRAQAVKFTGQQQGEAYTNRYKALVDKERAIQSQLTEAEITKITESVVASAQSGQLSDEDAGRTTEMLIKEAISDARKEKVRAISLNAEGYGMALETLKLQYPSIIRRVSYEPLKDFVNDRGLKPAIDPATLALRNRPGGGDSGYVRPGASTAVGGNKKWLRDEKGNLVAEMEAKAKSAAPSGGGGGGGGTGAAEPKKEGPKKVGSGKEVFENLMAVRRDQVAAAKSEAKMPAGLEPDDSIKMDDEFKHVNKNLSTYLGSSLADMDAKGPDVEVSGNPGWLGFLGKADVSNAVRNDHGITLGMVVAYRPEVMDDTNLWDPDKDNRAEEARLGIDEVMSATLLTEAPIRDTPSTVADKYGFYIPTEVRAAVPDGDDIDVTEVLSAVEATAYDETTSEGKARMTAKAFLDKALSDPQVGLFKDSPGLDKTFGHGEDLTGVGDLSVLGLLAMQTRAMLAIETAAKKNSEQSRALVLGLNGGDEAAFDGSTDFDQVKKDLMVTVQEVFGTEYLRRVLGGGGVGPKGQLQLAKSASRPVWEALQEYLLARSIEKSAQHPRIRPQVRSRPK